MINLKNDIKVILKINDTNLYDDELDIYIPMAQEKAKNEGIIEPLITDDNKKHKMYTVIIGYEVAKNIDIDVDMKKLNSMYLTLANTYRLSY